MIDTVIHLFCSAEHNDAISALKEGIAKFCGMQVRFFYFQFFGSVIYD